MNPDTNTAYSFGSVGTVTKDDAVDIPKHRGRYPRALYCNGAGDVACVAPDGTVGILTVTAGAYIMAQVRRVNSTGSTITASIVPLY